MLGTSQHVDILLNNHHDDLSCHRVSCQSEAAKTLGLTIPPTPLARANELSLHLTHVVAVAQGQFWHQADHFRIAAIPSAIGALPTRFMTSGSSVEEAGAASSDD